MSDSPKRRERNYIRIKYVALFLILVLAANAYDIFNGIRSQDLGTLISYIERVEEDVGELEAQVKDNTASCVEHDITLAKIETNLATILKTLERMERGRIKR